MQGDDLDPWLNTAESKHRLLLQLNSYGDGNDIAGYGPGGSLYAMIPENDLAEKNFDAAQLTGQFT